MDIEKSSLDRRSPLKVNVRVLHPITIIYQGALDMLSIIDTETVGNLIGQCGGVHLRRVAGSKATKKGEDEESGSNKNSDLAEDRLASTKVGPLSVGVSNVTLELLISELVVDHATESNGVTKELERRNLGAPDHHGSTDQENILQYTTEGKDDSRSLANLKRMLVGLLTNIRQEKLTRKTTETLSMKAQRPFRKKVNRPTW